MVSAKHVLGIFTREHPDLYQWLVRFLLSISVVKDVRPVVITNNFFEFQQEEFKCSFAILYHSKRRGRLNVTDVTDSLYDRELQHLNETFGRKRVLVVIDDLEDSSDHVKMEILNSQQSIKNQAEELFLFSTAEKALLEDMKTSGYQSQSDLKNKLDRMKLIIEETCPLVKMVSKKCVVGIFTREHPDLYQWLVRFLLSISVVKDVRPVVITNNFFEFQQEVFKCNFVILYHSKRRGRLNVTDVTDSLYDRELQHLNGTFGRKRVLVVIDDLEDSSDHVKMEILNSQQSIQNLAEELFLFSTTENALLGDMTTSGYQSQSDLKNKLDRMKSIIEGKKEESRSVSWREETIISMPDPGPDTQTLRKRYRSSMCTIGIGIVISIFVVALLPFCTTIKKKEEKTALGRT
ncbi:uncharacterized protein [Aquarana catesbeiana]|uniref:uncharacterized protein n=1 Tax=Aquarana catesbeiana TaxID=8400 RepID=UPI003CC9EDD8